MKDRLTVKDVGIASSRLSMLCQSAKVSFIPDAEVLSVRMVISTAFGSISLILSDQDAIDLMNQCKEKTQGLGESLKEFLWDEEDGSV